MLRSHLLRRVHVLLLCASVLPCVRFQAFAADGVTIRRVAMLGGNAFELEISASQPVRPQVQLITGPDRLVLDFAGALPANELRNLTVNRGAVKSVRVGLFAKNPPVTRVVIDLKQAQTYQLFPSGNTVIVKLGGGAMAEQKLSSPAATVMPVSLPQPKPEEKVEVRYENGWLSIWANRATLAEVLYEIHKKTGADVPVPAGAEQDLVVTSLGPAPAREVLASLLNGSRFNFIVVGEDGDPAKLKSVLLTLRGDTTAQPMITYTQPAVAQSAPAEAEAEASGPSDPQPDNQQPPAKDDPTPPPQ